MRVAAYARVSTSNNGQDPQVQLRELREYASQRGWQIVAEYVDNGVSGAKASRPRLDRMMAAAHERSFNAVLVWKFDRFARSVSHLLRALETFSSLGISFVSLSEQIDTSTPMGKTVFTILGAVAELERSLTQERVKAGVKHARAKRARWGRMQACVDLEQVRSLLAAGKSMAAIGKELGVSTATVCRRTATLIGGGRRGSPRRFLI